MQESSAPSRRSALIALGIFALAFAIRLVHVYSIRSAPFFTLLMGDSHGYDEWARRIAGGDWVGRDVFYQAPLYPYFLAAIYKVAGRDLFIVRIIQSAIGSLSCALLFVAGRRLFSVRAGIVAGLILAVWAPAIFFDALIQKSVLDVFFVCVVLALMTRDMEQAGSNSARVSPRHAIRSPNLRWLWIGFALGGLALTRENALVFVIVVAVWSLLKPGGLQNLAMLAAGVTIVLAPVAARNAYVGGGFFITTSQFGPNFYIGNNPAADGTYASLRYGRGAPEYERQDATDIAERAAGRRLTAGEVSSYWTDQALTFITSQPGKWLRLMGRKFLLLWNATEMVDTESQASHAEWSWPLSILGPLTHFGLLVPLAFLGVVTTWKSGSHLRILIALTLGYAASVLAFYVFARYRYPLVPLLILFAAAGIFQLSEAIRNRQALAMIAVSAVAVFANWPVVPRDWLRAVSENNIAVALQSAGRYDEAIAHYRRATALRPGFAPAINNLGTALRASGRVQEAIAAYQQALAARSDYPEAHYNLANALNDAGREAEAVEHFQIALASMPASADVHNNLGIALSRQGKVDDAIAQFREAVLEDPRSAKARRNLGDALLTKGVAEEAVQQMREAVALAPEDGSLHYDFGSALLELGRADEAAVELREAVRRLPQSAEARNNFGIALGTIGRLDDAIAQFRDALSIKPDFADARRNLETALAARRRSSP